MGVGFTLVLALVAGPPLYDTYCCEINSSEYGQVRRYFAKYPEVNGLISDFLEDGRIMNYEFKHLQNEVVKIREKQELDEEKSKIAQELLKLKKAELDEG